MEHRNGCGTIAAQKKETNNTMTLANKIPALFTPFTLRGVTFKNRIAMSPMCQYSYEDGFANDWALVNIGSRAVGQVGLIIMEATAVSAEGRISPQDLGLWKDEHMPKLKQIVDFVHTIPGAKIGIQLAHSGRKGSTYRLWAPKDGGVSDEEGGWTPVAPSPVPFVESYRTPHELTREEIEELIEKFVAASKRAVSVGYDVIEIHGAHGYLIHEFYSQLSNQRTDEFGGSFENRTRFLVEICKRVRQAIPESMPLFVRLSTVDASGLPNEWTIEDTVQLAKILKGLGVDLIDCSAGANVPKYSLKVEPGYQVPFAEQVKKEAEIATGAVGMLTEAKQCNEVIESGKADLVLLARELLRDPYFPINAAIELGHKEISMIVPQYQRAYHFK